MDTLELSADIIRVVDSAGTTFRKVDDVESRKPVLAGGWSRRQVLGHLIDSASNNHQRFVRACLQDSLEFPGYDQNGRVQAQAPEEADWALMVTLWASYNLYLAHVVTHLPPAKLQVPCRLGSKDPVTLGFVVENYLRHLLHHLRQIGAAPLQ
jgi:hypothetical protein